MKKIVPTDAVLVPKNATRKFEGVIYDVYQWPQKQFDGSTKTFEMLRRPDTVAVIPIVDDAIMVLEDEQPHSGMRLSFPGGRVDSDDDGPLRAAQREMHEETGYSFANWRLIKVWQPHSKIEWFIHLYIASNVADKEEPHLDVGEKITLKTLPFQAVKELSLSKAGYLGEAAWLFEQSKSTEDLLTYPEFTGKEVESD